MKKIALLFSLISLAAQFHAQSVLPDSSFGQTGVVATPFRYTGLNAYGNFLVAGPNGSVIIAGDPYYDSLEVVRYLHDGTPDQNFRTPLSNFYSFSLGISQQQDEKILVAGSYKTIPSQTGVVRLHPDGGLDADLGNQGLTLLNVKHAYVVSVMELANQKILVFGCESTSAENPPAIITRLNADGSPDLSFGSNGHLRIDTGPSYDFIPNAVELPNGSILFAGMTGWKLMLMQILPNGQLDASFGSGGMVIYQPVGPQYSSEAYDLTLLPDGKILVTGYTEMPSDSYAAIVAKFLPNGELDKTFGEDWVHFIPSEIEGSSIVVQNDGKIISSLFGYTQSQEHAALVQILPNGMRDSSFGVNGVYLLPPPMNQPMALLLSGNELTVLGRTRPGYKLYLHRLLLDLSVGVLNPTFEQPDILVYPNPIAQSFNLEFELKESAQIQVSLLDMQGKMAHEVLWNQTLSEGTHAITGSLPTHLPSGNYVLSIRSGQTILKNIQVVKG